MNDLYKRIFLKVCLHAAVTYVTFLVWYLFCIVAGEGAFDSLCVCIFVTNCTTLILSKLNRILERLPEKDEQE